MRPLSVQSFPPAIADQRDSSGFEVASALSPHRPPEMGRGKCGAIIVLFLDRREALGFVTPGRHTRWTRKLSVSLTVSK